MFGRVFDLIGQHYLCMLLTPTDNVSMAVAQYYYCHNNIQYYYCHNNIQYYYCHNNIQYYYCHNMKYDPGQELTLATVESLGGRDFSWLWCWEDMAVNKLCFRMSGKWSDIYILGKNTGNTSVWM